MPSGKRTKFTLIHVDITRDNLFLFNITACIYISIEKPFLTTPWIIKEAPDWTEKHTHNFKEVEIRCPFSLSGRILTLRKDHTSIKLPNLHNIIIVIKMWVILLGIYFRFRYWNMKWLLMFMWPVLKWIACKAGNSTLTKNCLIPDEEMMSNGKIWIRYSFYMVPNCMIRLEFGLTSQRFSSKKNLRLPF